MHVDNLLVQLVFEQYACESLPVQEQSKIRQDLILWNWAVLEQPQKFAARLSLLLRRTVDDLDILLYIARPLVSVSISSTGNVRGPTSGWK
jgi:hypothetical protein